jgi:hypothetical protein
MHAATNQVTIKHIIHNIWASSPYQCLRQCLKDIESQITLALTGICTLRTDAVVAQHDISTCGWFNPASAPANVLRVCMSAFLTGWAVLVESPVQGRQETMSAKS